ncbi:MAG: excinuclease ABC subunit UvrA [Acidobacteria bacterium]|nr:excinuclease ABC subunit UvrA [Acidobacteriota bacterium]
MSQDFLEIKGARVHNLKGVDLRLPHNQLIVVTGVSGSGKSSLVFDTIYAEGQRRYVESLSAYARQFLERMEKPDVDEIVGVAPAVAIRQKNSTRNPRSTVATATEIYDFLRLLFARTGRTFCSNCGEEVRKDTVDQVAAQVLALPDRSRWYALFPVPDIGPKGLTDTVKAHLTDYRSKGYNRLYQRGTLFEFSTPESLLDLDFTLPVYVLIDRLAIGPDIRDRVVEATEIGFREVREVTFESADGKENLWFSERFECRNCGIGYPEPEPQLFSFNSPIGACPRCQGFGNTVDYDMDLVIPDRFKTIKEGPVEPWTKPKYTSWQKDLMTAAKKAGVRTDVPFHELDKKERKWLLEGGEGFVGVKGFFDFLETKKYKMSVRILMARYRGYTLCPDCGGGRLRREALNVLVAEKTIRDVTAMSLEEAKSFFEALELEGARKKIGEQLLLDIRSRLQFLNEVGLEYLTLDRLSSTLSGGEAQRIQLATSLGSRLVGACYVLDEPSIGLHVRDTDRLVGILERLRDLGNTIVVVEHEAEVMRAADHVVDLGPGAGEHGGEVIFHGTYSKLVADGGSSLTGQYLSGSKAIAVPKERRKPKARKAAKFFGCVKHNLQNIDVSIPEGLFTVITGVSGSGKSTLVHEVIFEGLEVARKKTDGQANEDDGLRLPCRKITGAQNFNEVVLVDQSPIGRSPRSNPVTYVKAFDEIRKLFAGTQEARRRGMTPGWFSFNVPGGRCETCQGDGVQTVEMQFLADVELVCEDCGGKRFGPKALEIRYDGKNIHDVLSMTVDEALRFFAQRQAITRRLGPLAEVGLGYLRLGQAATTLSGGEAQRVKLAAYIAQSSNDNTLYIFDEPTTGLHFDDIAKLLKALNELIENGGTVLCIEHNLDVIKCADWVVDLGPEGGSGGGKIVVEGTPEEVAACKESHTGRFLKSLL